MYACINIDIQKTYIHVYVMCASLLGPLKIHMYIHTYMHIHVVIPIRIYIRADACLYVHVFVYVHVYIHVYVGLSSYIYTPSLMGASNDEKKMSGA